MFLEGLLLAQHCSFIYIYEILFNSHSCEVDAVSLKEKDYSESGATTGDKLNVLLLRETHQDAIWRLVFLGLVI